MRIINVILFLVIYTPTFAQDIHFSFSEFSGQNLNPAQSGAEDFFVVRGNYRTQWGAVGAPFKTASVGADIALVKQKRKRSKDLSKGWFGLGLNTFNDVSGNLPFRSNHVGVNLAYHQPLSVRSRLSFGVYGAYQERIMESMDGKWPSQYDGSFYDPTISSGEVEVSQKFSFIDSGVGLMYAFHRFQQRGFGENHFSFYAGVSMYHLNRPMYSFTENSNERLRFRSSLYLGSIIGLGFEELSLMPMITYNNHINANEIIMGSYIKYYSVAAGLFVRADDTFTVKGLIEKETLTIGLAFDMIVSTLKSTSRTGAIELCLLYKLPSKHKRGCFVSY